MLFVISRLRCFQLARKGISICAREMETRKQLLLRRSLESAREVRAGTRINPPRFRWSGAAGKRCWASPRAQLASVLRRMIPPGPSGSRGRRCCAGICSRWCEKGQAGPQFPADSARQGTFQAFIRYRAGGGMIQTRPPQTDQRHHPRTAGQASRLAPFLRRRTEPASALARSTGICRLHSHLALLPAIRGIPHPQPGLHG